jgi:hypothetical protein
VTPNRRATAIGSAADVLIAAFRSHRAGVVAAAGQNFLPAVEVNGELLRSAPAESAITAAAV